MHECRRGDNMNRPTNEYRERRLENMRKLEETGRKPFGCAFERSDRIAGIKAAFEEGKHARIAGRLMSIRNMGKSIFCDLADWSGRFQIYVQRKGMGEESFAAFESLDIGDHIGVEGSLFVTRMGEQTLKVDNWTMLSKALLPLPEKWHGLKDVEARYRRRYLDLVANEDARRIFDLRAAALREIREFLSARGFVEVETPMIQARAGGAAARPFRTRYDALSCDMFLRIAPELYLKRLLVGGFDKVFELNRSFRNEGLDRTHNPEFTMLEIYEAYSDVNGMKKLAQELIVHTARKVCGTLEFGEGDSRIDLTPPWKEVAYRDLIRGAAGEDWFDLPANEAGKRAEAMGLQIEAGWNKLLITHEVYEKAIEKTLIQPVFVTRFPAPLVPLARLCPDDPDSVDVFELEIGGREIAPGYSELNDPIEQRKRLAAQTGGEDDRIDEDFIEALEHGMPPAGGMGIGIDRLMMILTGSDAIRDVILFPQLRPLEE